MKQLRVWTSPDSTRVVLDISQPTPFKVFTLDHPQRVVIDLKDTQLTTSLDKPLPTDSGILRIRQGKQGKDLRLVLDVEALQEPQVFNLAPNENYGPRLVIDLSRELKLPPATNLSKPILAPLFAARDVIVAIDAGHGGEDPGAIGRHYGTQEKDVVLAVAKKLANLINQQAGMQAVLIRKGDYYIGLRQRIALARQYGTDLFISLHADSFTHYGANGASAFILSQQGASSEAARWLAEKENRADLIGGVSLDNKGDLLASVLLDLSQTANSAASETLANKVLKNLTQVVTLHQSQIQQAGFAVLKSPDVPSILVELGFLSNREGERQLRQASHQWILAKALAAGIKEYLVDRPPMLTPIMPRSHQVTSGETLGKIAQQYQVTIAGIKQMNHLLSDQIRVGQILNIPVQHQG
jgi:N-acetylmuramoyl-L-alanine amidase